MKTFKLCSLVVQLDKETEPVEIPIIVGLIINKEEKQKNWLIEAIVSEDWEKYFWDIHKSQQPIMAEVTITNKTNDPATFVCTVKSINKLNNKVSVFLDGLLVAKEDDFSDTILRSIIDEGFEGEEIIAEFKKRKKDRSHKMQGAVNNAFVKVKGKFFE
ncbi:YwpF-like family protein [Bacillaceae bacterium IKA-2]|jgi:hypothetical protein|nr:YwpF-like family protein [Bacillaceae bacterium IKA-2]